MSTLDDTTPRYHVRVDGQIYGPYPAAVLSEWIALGKVTDDTPVQTETGQWIVARDWIRNAARRAVATPMNPTPSPAATTVASPAASPATPPPIPPELMGTASNGQAPSAGRSAVRRNEGPAVAVRDRVVVIGRRQSGKTIFLASIYARLWRGLHGMTAKAVSGQVHQQLMDTYQTLQRGRWPAATLDTMQVDLDLDYNTISRRLVTLDFAGEMFRKAFVEEQTDFPGVAELIDHIDHAAAVLLLVDPAVASGTNHDAAMDDDFGLVQAAERIRNSPGGALVPIALVLTKADQHQALIDAAGGAPAFVKHYFPALIRLLKQIPVFQVSAVQSQRLPDGRIYPRADSEPINVEAPLRFCLDRIDAAQREDDAAAEELARAKEIRRAEQEELHRDHKANQVVVLSVLLILLIGAGVVTWILTRHAS